MPKVRLTAAFLLAIPLLVFGGNYFLNLFTLPAGDGLAGDQLLQSMRDHGLMAWIALSHVVIGACLLLPATRFAAGLLNLPMSLGIVAFHASMLPAGNALALGMLALNVLVVANGPKLRELLRAGRSSSTA